ncbi:MAG: hypothetical protein ACKO3I_07080, partial [Synechococcales cyanobacterium]
NSSLTQSEGGVRDEFLLKLIRGFQVVAPHQGLSRITSQLPIGDQNLSSIIIQGNPILGLWGEY